MSRERRTLNMVILDGSVSDGIQGHRSVAGDIDGQHVADVTTVKGVGRLS